MATSTIKLFNTIIREDNNYLIEHIEEYLRTCMEKDFETSQYIRHDSLITVKINMEQSKVLTNNYNYCSIKNSDDTDTMYYFIEDIKQISQNTLELTLIMDVVNSLGQPGNIGHPKKLDKRTLISRQHKDRYLKPLGVISTRQTFIKNIDRIPEDISAELIKSNSEIILDDESISTQEDDLTWNIIYYKQYTVSGGTLTTDTNQINVCLVPNKSIKAYVGEQTIVTAITDNSSNTIDVNAYGNPETISGDNFVISETGGKFVYDNYEWEIGLEYIVYIPAVNDFGFTTTKKTLNIITIEKINGIYQINFIFDDATKFKLGKLTTATSRFSKLILFDPSLPSIFRREFFNLFHFKNITRIGQTQLPQPTIITTTLPSYDSIDKRNYLIIKSIQIPYCFLRYEYKNNAYYFSDENDNWVISDFIINPAFPTGTMKVLKLDNYDTNLIFNKENLSSIELDIYDELPLTRSNSEEINNIWDPKLNNSQFNINKLVYDSSSLNIKLENFKLTGNSTKINLPINYCLSSNLSSDILFSLDYDYIGEYINNRDFEVLLTNRNNENLLYTSDYLNYIANGYNQDIATNKLNLKQNLTNNIINGVTSTGNSFARGFMIGGGKAGAILAVSSAVNSIIKSTSSQILLKNKQELEMQNNLTTLANQSLNIIGNGNLNIFNNYSENKLLFMRYEPIKEIKDNINEYFRLYGYADMKYGTPNTDTRCNFNYIQCNPVYTHEGRLKYHRKWIDILSSKYQEGVTVFHDRYDDIHDEHSWDLDQEYENYETWLLTE